MKAEKIINIDDSSVYIKLEDNCSKIYLENINLKDEILIFEISNEECEEVYYFILFCKNEKEFFYKFNYDNFNKEMIILDDLLKIYQEQDINCHIKKMV